MLREGDRAGLLNEAVVKGTVPYITADNHTMGMWLYRAGHKQVFDHQTGLQACFPAASARREACRGTVVRTVDYQPAGRPRYALRTLMPASPTRRMMMMMVVVVVMRLSPLCAQD